MKPNLPALLAALLLTLLPAAPAAAELSFSGEAVLGVTALPAWHYDSTRFDTPLTPGKIGGLHDLSLDYALDARLAGGEEQTGFRFRLIFAPGGPPQILRAHIGWRLGESFWLRLGRQSLLTGYGYGWNPMDFANPLKDPADPRQELAGVDAFSLLLAPGPLLTFRLAAVYRPEDFAAGINWKDLQGAASLVGCVSPALLESASCSLRRARTPL